MTTATGAICTTLNAIWAHNPCTDGWHKLLSYLGKTGPDDEPLPLATILDSNGLDDAIWALRSVTGEDRRIRLYAVWCARQVQHLMTDQRSLAALEVAERYANGMATAEELAAAQAAAWDAAWAAAETAGSAARAAAQAAARAVAWAAAQAAARAAAWAAAQAAAGNVTWAERRYTVWAEAYNAAGDAAMDAQAAEFRRVFGGDA